jgi:hypothetical protein
MRQRRPLLDRRHLERAIGFVCGETFTAFGLVRWAAAVQPDLFCLSRSASSMGRSMG